MMAIDAGRLKDRVRIERPTSDDSLDGAGSGSWSEVATVWAEVQDMLPSRGERIADGVNVQARPARVRMRLRDDVDGSMRFVFKNRVLQIVSGPARLDTDGMEFVAEEHSPAGNRA